jgi:molecular chaperone DnaK
MPGRLAVDFGTSNTVAAVWDEARGEGVPLRVPDYGRVDAHGGEHITIIPSLIHYAEDKRTWLGNQVLARNLERSNLTFKDMKRYISIRSPVAQTLSGGRRVTHAEAGREFLSAVLTFAKTELGIEDEEVVFTVPVDSYEHYVEWLTDVAEAAGMPRFRLIDEPSAAALGYAANIQPNDVYLVFDFGGGTLDVAIVIIEGEDRSPVGRKCRVLGKHGADLGGSVIDQWLFQEVLGRNDLTSTDEEVQQLSRYLLAECEEAKKKLSFNDRADVSAINPDTGAVIAADFTEAQFADLLERKGAFASINETIHKALKQSRQLGYDEDNIKAVLMVGGSSLIPSVQRLVKQRFGSERVKLERPMDAVARGAAAFVAGVDFYDHIQHDYAIRHVSAKTSDYDYRVIVKQGTPYPSKEPVARMTIKATYEGQSQLGVAIYEVGESRQASGAGVGELIFDPTGAARIVNVGADETERRTRFWMNEGSPTFLTANPPAKQGEARFQVEFNIDGSKRLLITARDLRTGRLTHKDHAVIKLT